MTTDEFKEQALLKNKYYKKGNFEILGEYINMKTKILCKDKYGLHLKKAEGIVKGENISAKTVIDYKIYFYNFLSEKSSYFNSIKDNLIDVLNEKGIFFCIIETNYGVCKISTQSILRGAKTSIKSAIDKTEYFINQIKELDIGITDYSTINYVDAKEKIVYGTCYGYCQMSPNSLIYCKRADTIESAVNKTEYIKNVILLERGEEYDLSLIDYKNNSTPIRIGCKLHGVFEVPTGNFIGSKSCRGCPKCGRENTTIYNIKNPVGWSYNAWSKAGEKSKYFDSYKVYVLECWNEYEKFYKIGRTFLKTNRRFRSNKLPYNYKVKHEFINDDPIYICNLEKELKKLNQNNKYIPNRPFEGMYECFSNIEDLQGYITLCRDRQNR